MKSLFTLLSLAFLLGCQSVEKSNSVENETPSSDFTVTNEPIEIEGSCISSEPNLANYQWMFDDNMRISICSFNPEEQAKLKYNREEGIMEFLPIEEIPLDSTQIVELLTSLVGWKNTNTFGGAADCYYPQNAILFYRNDSLKTYYEICFSCQKTETRTIDKTINPDFDYFCDKKWDALEKYFDSHDLLVKLEEN